MFMGKNKLELTTDSAEAKIPSLMAFPAFDEVVESVTKVLS